MYSVYFCSCYSVPNSEPRYNYKPVSFTFYWDNKIKKNEMAGNVARMEERCIWDFGGKS